VLPVGTSLLMQFTTEFASGEPCINVIKKYSLSVYNFWVSEKNVKPISLHIP
jgi:hypothetical protein